MTFQGGTLLMNNIFTEEQKKAIKSWTSPYKEYRYIKGVFKKTYNDSLKSIYENRANSLLSIFELNDNTDNNTLFRGDVLEDYTFLEFIKKYTVGTEISLGDSILSFTMDRNIATDSYKKSDKYRYKETPSILYIIENRISKFIDISRYSHFPNEKEVLSNKGKKFKITKVKTIEEDLHIELYLDEI